MDRLKTADEINQQRRRFFGAAAMAVAATQLGTIRPALAQPVGPGTGTSFGPLKQIGAANVASLKLKWVFPISYFGLETTPLAADGVLYVTGPNQVFALDALTGTALWQYSRPASVGMLGDAKLGTNRGVAILRDQVFFVTDNAHLLALDRHPRLSLKPDIPWPWRPARRRARACAGAKPPPNRRPRAPQDR